MRVFLDECLDWRLSRDIVGHEVKTARQMGWTAIKNGALLALAAQHFDVFVTADPQSIVSTELVRASDRGPGPQGSNRLADIRPLIPGLLAAIDSAPSGAAKIIRAD